MIACDENELDKSMEYYTKALDLNQQLKNEIDINEILENNKNIFDESFKYIYVNNLEDVIENALIV
jgi:hypothetical protein